MEKAPHTMILKKARLQEAFDCMLPFETMHILENPEIHTARFSRAGHLSIQLPVESRSESQEERWKRWIKAIDR